MTRPTKIIANFEIGDKVRLISSPKTEGVVVHHYSIVTDDKEWSVHWHKDNPVNRGIYKSTEIQKYY
jgi:hypothetical protein